mgnify:CR=1 FL=1
MAKRMALIPEEVLDRFERKQRIETSPIVADLMHEDMEMSDILRDPNIPDDEKQKLYNANLERYLELRQQKDDHIPTVCFAAPVATRAPPRPRPQVPPRARPPVPPRVRPPVAPRAQPPQAPRAPLPENAELPPDEPLPDADVLGPIPKTMQKRATTLLERLKTRPDLVSWDERGQVTIGGETIADSNISDLVSDAMRPRKNFNPTGSKRFFRVLSALNVPKDVARNQQRWQQSKAGGKPVNDENTTPRSRNIQSILKRRVGKHWLNY